MTTYINEVRPMVEKFHSDQEILERFEVNLNMLREEAIRFDDILKIFLCWQDGVGRELNQNYSLKELGFIHEFNNAEIKRFGSKITIEDALQQVHFHFCNHNIYTPIRSDFTVHQCLQC